MKHVKNLSLIILPLMAAGFIGEVPGQVYPPTVVAETFREQYPSATGIEWEIEKGNYEAEFTIEGREIEVLYDVNGNVLETERELFPAQIPATVASAFKARYPSYSPTRAVQIESPTTNYFKVTALSASTRELFVFDASGNELSRKVMNRDKPKDKHKFKDGKYGPSSVSRGFSNFGMKWELPVSLLEVSGIALLGESKMACVQDELGIIYIYDLNRNTIERQIEFAGPGDHEGIAIVGNDAFVLRSDALIYHVKNFLDDNKRSVSNYKLQLEKQAQNFEGLCYDEKNKRLLLAPREFETNDQSRKGIYSFDLVTMKFDPAPVFYINLNDQAFRNVSLPSKREAFIPSEIAVHPVTSDIYLSDARNWLVLVMDKMGNIKKIHELNRGIFPKTEGLAFLPDGSLYFSNEGKKSAANILKVHPDKLN